MNTKEYFVAMIKDETPRFERVLKALPKDKLDYKPDEKSRTALELASLMAMEVGMITSIVETGVIDFSHEMAKPTWTTPDEIAAAFVAGSQMLEEKVMACSEADWDSEAVMKTGGEHDWKSPRGMMVLSFYNDLIHHRGQISTYLRPMGGKVPSIYGPSADSQG